MPVSRSLNKDFFKTWSSRMAYVLGFFVADGSMICNKRGACYIEFHVTDEDILRKIRAILESDHEISKRKTSGQVKWAYRLQIGSKEMFSDLSRLGLTPCKSDTVQLPVVPDEYLSHFVRGYFDGDGNAYVYKKNISRRNPVLLSGFTCGSEAFLTQLQSRLRSKVGMSGGSLYARTDAHRLYFSTKNSILLYGFMYDSAEELFLQRKKEIFDAYLSMNVRR